MTRARQQPCLMSLQKEGKLASSPELTDLTASHNMGNVDSHLCLEQEEESPP